MNKPQYPSHSKVPCPKQGCTKEIRKDRLPEHLKTVHGETSCLPSGQFTLQSFFQKRIKEPKEIEVDTTTEPKNSPAQELLTVLQQVFLENESEGAKSLELQKFELQEEAQVRILDQLKNIRESEIVEPMCLHGLSVIPQQQENQLQENQQLENQQQEDQKQEDQKQGDQQQEDQQQDIDMEQHVAAADETSIKYGIPSKDNFAKFFQHHKKIVSLPAIAESQQQEASITQLNDDVKIVIDSSDLSGSTQSKKPSFFQGLKKRFKRRKACSPQENLSVSEMLSNVHDDVLVVQDSVNQINQKMSKLSFDSQLNESKVQDQEDSEVARARKVLISNGRSISDLLKYAHEIKANTAENYLYCRHCFNAELKKTKEMGIFTYNFDLGDDFIDKNKRMPREFINLKAHILRHFDSKVHIKQTKDEENEMKRKEKLYGRQYKVGMILGRQAYKILKTADSHSKYETDVVVLSEQGLDVGNLNHSRKFVGSFAESVEEVLMKEVQTLIAKPLKATGRPTPISVIADKLTPNRRTMQIVGFHGYVGGKVQSLVAGVPALKGGDGLGVTQCLRNGLSSLKIPYEQLPSTIVGGAFDGEYFHLGVPKYLLDMMLVPDEARKWYSFQWDPAHILELAEKDCFKNTSCDSVKETLSTISKISKDFSHGKSFRELLEEEELSNDRDSADEDDFNPDSLKTAVRVPGHFSETRFATYSSIVIDKWLNNYPVYYKILNRKQDDDLDRINNVPFLFSCGGLCDAYSVLGNLSNAIQKPSIPPWEVSSIIETHVSVLEKMADSLDPSKLSIASMSDSSIFPKLASMTKEISEKHEYKGCPMLTKLHSVRSTRAKMTADESRCKDVEDALKTSGKSVRTLIQSFICNFSNRISTEKSKNDILSASGNLFDVSRIIKRGGIDETVKTSLEEYSDLAKMTNNLTDDVELNDLTKEYNLFVERVKNVAPQYEPSEKKTKNNVTKPPQVQIIYPERYDQIDLYKKFLTTPELYKDIGNVLHLALTGICRTHCEAVVEGMGSVLCLHNQNRTTLDPKTVQTETIIRWQGPHPGRGATKLIENSLDKHFQGRNNWHFCTTDNRSKHFISSKVIKRINETASKHDKIPFE